MLKRSSGSVGVEKVPGRRRSAKAANAKKTERDLNKKHYLKNNCLLALPNNLKPSNIYSLPTELDFDVENLLKSLK